MIHKSVKLGFLLVTLSLIFNTAFATTQESDFDVFKSVYEIKTSTIQLPTVMKITLPNFQDFGVAIIETKNEQVQPIARIKKIATNSSVITVTEISPVRGDKNNFVDGNMNTVGEFDMDADLGNAYINLKYSSPIKSSSLHLNLDDHVALPYSVAIYAKVDGEWITALAKTSISDARVNFPQRNSDEWKIEIYYSQPLKIREMKLINDAYEAENIVEEVVWLARPGETYKLYADAAKYIPIQTGESGDLLKTEDEIIKATLGQKQLNATFKEPDDDSDGIPNYRDNCVSISNPKQEDIDGNNKGDACEDRDRDQVVDSVDNCSEYPNRSQIDTDGDGIGDACDDTESRITENLPWLPWAGMGFAALVVFGIVVQTLRKDKKS